MNTDSIRKGICDNIYFFLRIKQKNLFSNPNCSEEVVQNNKEDYYNAVLSSSSILERTVKDILYKISTIAHDYLPTNNNYEQIKNVKDVTAVLKDNNDNYSVADGFRLGG